MLVEIISTHAISRRLLIKSFTLQTFMRKSLNLLVAFVQGCGVVRLTNVDCEHFKSIKEEIACDNTFSLFASR